MFPGFKIEMIKSELIFHLERLKPDPLDHWCVAVSAILSTVLLCCGLDSVTKVGSAQSRFVEKEHKLVCVSRRGICNLHWWIGRQSWDLSPGRQNLTEMLNFPYFYFYWEIRFCQVSFPYNVNSWFYQTPAVVEARHYQQFNTIQRCASINNCKLSCLQRFCPPSCFAAVSPTDVGTALRFVWIERKSCILLCNVDITIHNIELFAHNTNWAPTRISLKDGDQSA